MRGQPPGCHGVARQRGSVTIMASIFVITAILLGIAFDAGYLFYMRRHLQAVADMAATAGAQALPDYDQVYARVNGSIQGNAFSGESLSVGVCGGAGAGAGTVQVVCGQWPGGANGNTTNVVNPLTSGDEANNAVQVTVSENVNSFFPGVGSRLVTRTAIAQKVQQPTAAFSIGSGLANVNPTMLNGVLSSLLGTTVSLSAITYQGLANANVKLLDLVNIVPLSAGSMDQLLNTEVSVASLLNASLNALSPTQIAALGISAGDIQALSTAIAGSALGQSTIALSDILNVSLSNVQQLLATNLNVGDLVMFGLEAANAKNDPNHLLDLGSLITVPGVGSLALKAAVIESPKTAIGEPGQNADGSWKTQAHTAQIRLYLDLGGITGLGGSNNLIPPLSVLGIVNATLNLPSGSLLELPINLEVAPGQAWLADLQCNNPVSTSTATIGAQPGIANIFLGKMPTAFTNTTQAWADLEKDPFNLISLAANINLLFGLIPVLNAEVDLTTQLGLQVSGPSTQHVFSVSDIGTATGTWTVGTQYSIGAALANALFPTSGKAFLNTDNVKLTTNLSVLGIPANALGFIVNWLTGGLVNLLGSVSGLLSPVLTPVLQALDPVLTPLLNALGVQLGYADVRLLWVNCDTVNNVQLVY